MTYPLYTRMALRRNLPDHGLCRGDVVTLVEHLRDRDGEEGYAIEVFSALGETIALTALEAGALEPLTANQVFRVRRRLPGKRRGL